MVNVTDQNALFIGGEKMVEYLNEIIRPDLVSQTGQWDQLLNIGKLETRATIDPIFDSKASIVPEKHRS